MDAKVEHGDLEPIASDAAGVALAGNQSWWRVALVFVAVWIAVSMTIIAAAQVRQARVAERVDCRDRAVMRNGGNPGPEVRATIAIACGGEEVPPR